MKNVLTHAKRCPKCALPEFYPGISFEADGTCNYCRYFKIVSLRNQQAQEQISSSITKMLEEKRGTHARYDALLCYSGGKDSTYLLYHLARTMRMRILAFTIDNGFISPTALMNARNVTDMLNTEHIIVKPKQQLLQEIFRRALTQPCTYPKEIISMMSPLCTTCQGIVIGTAIRTAVEKQIPIVFTGYTPAQYPAISMENFMKARSCLFFSHSIHKDDPPDMLRIVRAPIEEHFGHDIDQYYWPSQYLREGETIPSIIFPFHSFLNYNEKNIYALLKSIGWRKPSDTDPCSTNCTINVLGNYASLRQFGFHPYIGEMSFLVRQGIMQYSEALTAEAVQENGAAMKHALQKLRITKGQIYGSHTL
jgi:hypothetical protein